MRSFTLGFVAVLMVSSIAAHAKADDADGTKRKALIGDWHNIVQDKRSFKKDGTWVKVLNGDTTTGTFKVKDGKLQIFDEKGKLSFEQTFEFDGNDTWYFTDEDGKQSDMRWHRD